MKQLFYALFEDADDKGMQIIHFLADPDDATEDMEWVAYDLLGDTLGELISRKNTMGWILSDIYTVTINDRPIVFDEQEIKKKELE